MGTMTQTPSGAVSILDLYRACAQDDSVYPTSSFSMGDSYVRKLIPDANTWDSTTQIALSNYQNRRCMFSRYKVGVKTGSSNYWGYTTRPTNGNIYPLGSGDTSAVYRYKHNVGWQSCDLWSIYFGTSGSSIYLYVELKGNYASWGNVTVYFADGTQHTLTSPTWISSINLTRWVGTVSSVSNYLKASGGTVYFGLAFSND